MEAEQSVGPATPPVPLTARQVPVLVWIFLTYCMLGLLGFMVYKVFPDYFELLDRFVATGLKLPIGLVVLEKVMRPLQSPTLAMAVWGGFVVLVLSFAAVPGRVGEILQRVLVFTIAGCVMVTLVAWVQLMLALRAYIG